MKSKIFFIYCLTSLFNFVQGMENNKGNQKLPETPLLHFADKNFKQIQENSNTHNAVNVTLNITMPDGSVRSIHYLSTKDDLIQIPDPLYGFLAFQYEYHNKVKCIKLNKKLLDLLEEQNKQID